MHYLESGSSVYLLLWSLLGRFTNQNIKKTSALQKGWDDSSQQFKSFVLFCNRGDTIQYHGGLRSRELCQAPMLLVFLTPRQALSSHPRQCFCASLKLLFFMIFVGVHEFSFRLTTFSNCSFILGVHRICFISFVLSIFSSVSVQSLNAKPPQPTEISQYKNNSCTLKQKTEFSFN